MKTSKKTRTFKAEVRQLLDLVIHSLYSKKEIFLRELISNASDAIDRARFESLTDKSIARDDAAWRITLRVDRDNRTLTVSDNGIGMSAEELEKHIGTIAHSGTKHFLSSTEHKEQEAAEFIGQFGVGFYASFMVADRVTVLTRRAGSDEPAVLWKSDGVAKYSMQEAERDDFGTDITLHLREDMDEYLDEWRLRSVVKAYSDFIRFPIVLLAEPEEGKDPEEKVLNSQKALWRKAKNEIEEQEYNEFYHQLGHDFKDPLRTIHYHAEGTTEFTALLYIPATAPYDLYVPREHRGLHLYVRNVFITDDCRDLLPEYLRFVQGVVDSSDLPLNVSREMLQDDAVIRRIRKSLVGRILATLSELAEQSPEEYATFWSSMGSVVKEGVAAGEDQDKIMDLLRFPSTAEEARQPVSLNDYVERMPKDQDAIYYLVGDRLETLRNAPHLEKMRQEGLEVLLMADPVDEWVAQRLTTFQEKPFKAADRLEAGDREQQEGDETRDAGAFKDLLETFQKKLDEEVKEVRLSDRLVDSPSCLVADETALNPHMERMLKAMGQDVPKSKRILEINPDHPLTALLQKAREEDAAGPLVQRYIDLLYDMALMAEGSAVRDPADFAKSVGQLMVDAAET